MTLDAGSAYVDIEPRLQSGFFSKLGSKLGPLKGVGIAAGGVLAAGLAAGIGAFKLGETFDQAFDTIRVGTGATGDLLEGLKDDFREVLRDVPASTGDAATAIADLNTRLGLTGDDLQNVAAISLDLARITGGDLSNQIDLNTRLFGDWGIATEDQAGALDALFRASQNSGAGVEDLASSVVQFGAPLRQLGFGFEDSLALFAKWNKEGVNTETVLSGVRQGISKFAREGKNVPDAFKEALETIQALESDSEATGLAIEVFGARAGPDMAAAIREGRFELGDMLDVIANGTETIQGAAADTESFGEKWTRIKNRVLLALEPIATRVFDALGTALDNIGPITDTVATAFQSLMAFAQPAIDAISGFFSSFSAGSESLGGSAQGLLDRVKPILEQFGAAFEVARTIVADVFGALSARGEAFQETFASIWANVGGILEGAQALFQTVLGAIEAFWEQHGERITKTIVTVWENIAKIIDGALQVIKGVINTVTAIIKGDWSGAWEGIKGIVSGAWNIIKGIVGGATAAISTTIVLALDAIQLVWDRIWGSLSSGVQAVWDGIVGAVKGALNGLLSAIETGVNFALRGLQKAIDAADVLAGPFINFPDAMFTPISIPRLAEGGKFLSSGVALVGEEGPEVASFPKGAQVAPLDALGGSIDLTVTIDGRAFVQAFGLPLARQIQVASGVRAGRS